MSTSATPPALLSAMQTMLREAINRLVPPIVEQMLTAKVGTIVRGGRLQSGAMVGTIPAPVMAASLPDATVGAIGAVEVDQAPGSGHPVALTLPRLGAANGVAELDAGGKLPIGELPAAVVQNPMTAAGDLIDGGAGGAPARLPIGSAGQVLTVVSGAPAWQTQTALTNPMTAQDDLIVGDAAGTPARLAKGTSGQVLTVDATSGHLAWDTPAGGGGGALTKIAETIVAGSVAATISFTTIPGTYRHLELALSGRGDVAATSTDVAVQCNGDTTASYAYQQIFSNGAGVSGANGGGLTGAIMASLAGGTAPANDVSLAVFRIGDYARTVWKKAMVGTTTMVTGEGAGGLYAKTYHGLWVNTAAVTSVTLTPTGGNFAIGTVASLYGVS